LPAAAYSALAASPDYLLGMAFERQSGVHAISGGPRQDFDAWPGDFAMASPAVEIFSESGRGGEYLAVHIGGPEAEGVFAASGVLPPRQVFHGDRQAVDLGLRLRALLLASRADGEAVEEHVALLLERGLALQGASAHRSERYVAERLRHARVLEYIDDGIAGALPLDQLAGIADMPLLAFLRSFSRAIGITPHAYVTERRLQRARALLAVSDDSVAAIAAECGFAHQSHFGDVLKARLGLTPAQYRARLGKGG
jgi:AraC-like DNA-binding protein